LSDSDDDDDDDDGDDDSETDDSREDLRFDGVRTEAKDRNRRLRQRVSNARSERKVAPEKRIGGLGRGKPAMGRKLATSGLQSVWNECPGRSRYSSERERSLRDECDSAVRCSRRPQSGVDVRRSGKRSSRRTRFKRRVECSDSKLLCDEQPRQLVSTTVTLRQRGVSEQAVDRLREHSDRPRCSFGFTSASSIRSLLTDGDVQKPAGVQENRTQKNRHRASCDVICAPGCDCEPHGEVRGSSQLVVMGQNCTRSGSEMRTETSSTRGGLMNDATNNSFSESSVLRRRCSQTCDKQRSCSAVVSAHGVTSSSDKPCEAFNSVDVVDPSPDLAVDHSRHSSADKPVHVASSVGGHSSRRCSTDRSGLFSGVNLVGSSSGWSSSRAITADGCDSSRPPATVPSASRPLSDGTVADGAGHVEHGCPSVVFQFYSDCTECPHCLNYAVCGACNTFHEHKHDVEDCLPLASDLCDRVFLGGNDVSDPAARGRYWPCNAELASCETGRDEFLCEPAAACSAQDMHRLVDRKAASTEDCRGTSAGQRSRSSVHSRDEDVRATRLAACTRLRSLHFYTDCADCPQCCSSLVCGSCCSVHGPPEEPADMSPRCASSKHRPDDVSSAVADVVEEMTAGETSDAVKLSSRDDSASRISKQGANDVGAVPEDSATAESRNDAISRAADVNEQMRVGETRADHTGSAAGNEASIVADNSDLTSVETDTVTSELPDASSENSQSTSSGGDAADEDCWTFVEKATCGLLAFLTLVVLFAIYLQLTRRYFTGI